MNGEPDVWREELLTLVESFADPLAVLMVLAAFVLGLMSVRAVA